MSQVNLVRGVLIASVLVSACGALPPFNSRIDAGTALSKATTYCQYGEHPGDPACNKAQSWDQENLKRNDHGCPSAIFDAPNGNLRLCPME